MPYSFPSISTDFRATGSNSDVSKFPMFFTAPLVASFATIARSTLAISGSEPVASAVRILLSMPKKGIL